MRMNICMRPIRIPTVLPCGNIQSPAKLQMNPRQHQLQKITQQIQYTSPIICPIFAFFFIPYYSSTLCSHEKN